MFHAEGAPVYCSYTKKSYKLVLDCSLLVEDYRGLTFTLLNRSSAKIGANPWNDVEGVSSAGVHWISAVRYLPLSHPLRKRFELEFKESPVIKAIGKMKPPTRRTTTSALKCAEEFKNGNSDAEFVGVSQFWGTLQSPKLLSLYCPCCTTVVSSLLWFVSGLCLVCLWFVSGLSLVCL